MSETFAQGRKLGWTSIDPQRCDRCENNKATIVLHVGKDGITPKVPLAALCKQCIVDALENKTSRW